MADEKNESPGSTVGCLITVALIFGGLWLVASWLGGSTSTRDGSFGDVLFTFVILAGLFFFGKSK